jgi:hypothetical protein
MRHDAPTPALAVLDLLSRADALAVVATMAIQAGDEAQLATALDERSAVIDAAIAAWRAVEASGPSADLRDRVAGAARSTMASGQQARATAVIARDEVVAALSALEARQQASQEYQNGAQHGTINVVL